MELTQEQTEKLNKLLSLDINKLLAITEIATGISKDDIVIDLCDYEIINQVNDNNLAFIEQVKNLVNDGQLTNKKFRNLLSRIKYQNELGHIKNIKGYTLNAIAKETNQAIYKS